MAQKQTNTTFLIIDDDAAQARKLADMIEFLDAPDALLATTNDWHDVVADHSLSAVFLGVSMAQPTVDKITAELKNTHPDVPLVVVEPDANDD